MSHSSSTIRRRIAVMIAMAAAAASLAVAGFGPRPAMAEEECDAQCWAILYYLTQQGLTSEDIRELAESGITPDEPPPPVATTAPQPTTTTTTAPPVSRPPTNAEPEVWHTSPTPAAVEAEGCDPTETWSCDEVNSGIDAGYLPDDFNPHDPTQTEDLLEIIEEYGAQNPDFDEAAALAVLDLAGQETDRGQMFNAIAAGLGIPFNPEDGGDVATELGDLGIVHGHDDNPASNPRDDADPDATLSNAALAALLDRVSDYTGNGRTSAASNTVSRPAGGGPATPGPDACTADLVLAPGERSRLLAQLRWATLARIEARGEPGVTWPPHPDVPGGAEFLVVSESPVWPVADPGARWKTVSQSDGCVWAATHVETVVSQMLPWRSDHRQVLENAGTFSVFLDRWDSLSPSRQAQAIQRHRNGDVSARCPLEAATVSEAAYDQCRWELPEPGVWSWQARVCFEADAGLTLHRVCETLASGTEWFLAIIDYTSGITVRTDHGATMSHWAGHAARVA